MEETGGSGSQAQEVTDRFQGLLPELTDETMQHLRDGLASDRPATLRRILAMGALYYEACRRHGLLPYEELIKEWAGIAPTLPERDRQNWQQVIEHIQAMELGIGKEAYLAKRQARELAVQNLWQRIMERSEEADFLLSDMEPGIMSGYVGPVADFQTHVAKMTSNGIEAVQDPLFPPISMTYRILHRSWKAYRMRRLIAARMSFLLSLRGVVCTTPEQIARESKSMNPVLAETVSIAMDLDPKDANTETDVHAWILLAAEAVTGNLLRAMLWVAEHDKGVMPTGPANEAQALILEAYGLWRQ